MQYQLTKRPANKSTDHASRPHIDPRRARMDDVRPSRQSMRTGVHSVSPTSNAPVGDAAMAAPPDREEKESMPDLAYLALTVVCFVVLGLVVKAVEKL